MSTPTRRRLLKTGLALGAGLAASRTPLFAQNSETNSTQTDPEGFFTLGKRNNHWWLLTPDRKPFFSIGLNHIDNPVDHLDEWHRKTGMPVLLADAAKMKWQTEPGEFTRNNGQWYAETLAAMHQNPGCIGFHLCGAYQRNKARRYGLLDEMEMPDTENVIQMKAANERVTRKMTQRVQDQSD
ncbi:hypothetical protein Mal15_02220 [Stieleria maiorica]|uniref:Uncharacterized protein n=1 Tax=Stieleria maiorica TaxID=2795974 RepID=A0A5B9M9C0_9BACT|nr:hypothetical protein [Stieleria maiorica]QEF96195.1 hypothetical protein Mal15_02220 [Stieleria maiorica]